MDPTSAPLRLTGHGVVLREWTREDLAALAELFDDPDIAYRTPLESPFDPAAARRYLAKVERARSEGERVHLAITTDGERPLGEVMLNRVTGTMGYAVGAAHRGQRLAARALQVLTGYAHEVLALPQVALEIEPDNEPSMAVARAAGFHLTDSEPVTAEDKGRTLTLLTWARYGPTARP